MIARCRLPWQLPSRVVDVREQLCLQCMTERPCCWLPLSRPDAASERREAAAAVGTGLSHAVEIFEVLRLAVRGIAEDTRSAHVSTHWVHLDQRVAVRLQQGRGAVGCVCNHKQYQQTISKRFRPRLIQE